MTSPTPIIIRPPFTLDTARQKARMAEDAWNSRDPVRVSLAYTPDCQWRNRGEHIVGRDAIQAFLDRKWKRELEYRLVKELWGCRENRCAVRFQYEYHDDTNNWYRAYGNELWEFTDEGLMRRREASINEIPIRADQRRFHWDLSGPRPADHPGIPDVF